MILKSMGKAATLATLAGAVLMAAAVGPAEARRGRGHDDHLEGGHRSGHHMSHRCSVNANGEVYCGKHKRSSHHNEAHRHQGTHHKHHNHHHDGRSRHH